MNYDKLTETLRQHGVSCVRAYGRYCSICDEAATALSTLQGENEKLRNEADGMRSNWYKSVEEIKKLRAELEQVKVERDAYQVYFKDLSSKPDCNTCEKINCDYRPKLGATVRANCPLYSGPHKED